MHRITSHPRLSVEKGPKVSFTFNGKTLYGHEGESLAAALWANGISTLSRSEKYHRPRGLFCLAGYCSHCLMRIDGIPNSRSCQTSLRKGMVVETQNAWPSINFDLAACSTLFSRFIRPGFYYRYFKRSRSLYQIYEKALRKMAGAGTIATPGAVKFAKKKTANPQVLVVGAGYSGMQAAISAAQAGAEVVILERERMRPADNTAMTTSPSYMMSSPPTPARSSRIWPRGWMITPTSPCSGKPRRSPGISKSRPSSPCSPSCAGSWCPRSSSWPPAPMKRRCCLKIRKCRGSCSPGECCA